MPILSGDVKLLKSAVMADVPEGGGAPTGVVIPDGVSNAIFPDVSELDRAGGRVSLRKVVPAIASDDTDTYFGANLIVADPPQDPRVSVTLFATGQTFDTRTQAQVRVESYLNKGPEWGGYLFENHIAGQRAVQLFQRPVSQLPVVGQTLVLVQNEGLSTQQEQYVRATTVVSVDRLFYDAVSGQDYTAKIVTVGISDSLRNDYTGSPPARSFTRASAGTRIRDTIVADAGTYVGVVPLVASADVGDFTIEASSIFTQLVPSAQTEVPISDVQANGLSAALVPTGGAITRTLSLAFTSSQALFLGGPAYPGSISVVRSGVTVTDSGGVLFSAGAQVGTVDYDAGILTLATNVFGASSGSHQVTFTPATLPDLISSQLGIAVTPASRSLSIAVTLEEIPLPRTTSVSYMAQGRWYVLRDNGAGELRGADSSFGAGTVSFVSGSLSVTFGALPDVGSSIIVQIFSEASTTAASSSTLLNGGKFYVPINTSSLLSEEKGAKAIAVGGLTVTWEGGTATDNSLGGIIGDASGSVDYANGVIRISPNQLPPAGTTFLVEVDSSSPGVGAGVSVINGAIGAANIAPRSVSFTVSYEITYAASNERLQFYTRSISVNVTDTGAGTLVYVDPGNGQAVACGTINYTTGVINLTASLSLAAADSAGPKLYAYYGTAFGGGSTYSVPWSAAGGTRTAAPLSATVDVSYSIDTAAAQTVSVVVNQYVARTLTVPNYALRGVRFDLGATNYVQLPDNTLVYGVSPTTGGGTPAGSVTPGAGVVTLGYWTAGASSTIANWRGVLGPPTVGVEAPFATGRTTFRTAASPLRPSSFSVLGTMLDGTSFNVTADADGKINGARVKGVVSYEFGIVKLAFVDPVGDPALNIDLTEFGIGGLTTIPADLAMINSLRYNAVAYSYLPLDADLLGIDPVRLPSDGRVPIFRPGGFAVVGHTGSITGAVINGQTVDCGRVRLSRVRVVGDDGVVIHTGYSADLEAGTVTFADVTGYSQPVTVEHRIEDMAVVRDVQINGEISFTRALTHEYPAPGSYVSSALIAGDLFARVSHVFDQASWDGSWTDARVGSAATATFNNTTYPIVVSNRGALTERWAVRFTSSTGFEVIGENVGVIGVGNTSTDCEPNNPAAGVPYLSIPALGWGGGWAPGNVVRINTVGAQFPCWVVRTVQQGPETVPDDTFTLLIRGDVDTP